MYLGQYLKNVPGTSQKKDTRRVVPEEYRKSSSQKGEDIKGVWDQAVEYGQGITKKLVPLARALDGDKNSHGARGDGGSGGFFPAAGSTPSFRNLVSW